jgi:hypothetical protein
MLCDTLRCVAVNCGVGWHSETRWLLVLQVVGLGRQPTLRQHPVDAGEPDSSAVSVARRPL